MRLVGLTGTLGSGKSTVGRLFEAWGASRIDTDELAREVVRPGRPALERLRESWGDRVLASNGSLDRPALRRIVTEDSEARRRLEGIVHPAVLELLSERLDEARSSGRGVAVLEVPLLLEAGLDRMCDLVVTVDAPLEVRKSRVCGERGLSEREFTALNDAQLSGEEKRRRADIVVENAGSFSELEEAARVAWDSIRPTSEDKGGEARGGTDGLWSVDLHMHTCHSKDCLSHPADVIATARRVGLDRIAITDHDEIEGAFEAQRSAPALVIVGEEVRTAEGLDLIGLFLEEHIPPGGSFREVAEAIRSQGGITYLPHPFDRWRGSDEAYLASVIDCVDVVEAFNARVHDPARNERARSWARDHGLPVGAGSDAHTLREIGNGRVKLAPFDGPAGFVRSAAAGAIEGTASAHWVHLGSTWAKLRRRLPI
ncbi:MAG: dephospho-CoA kinase [Gemmatimonadales bacterium]